MHKRKLSTSSAPTEDIQPEKKTRLDFSRPVDKIFRGSVLGALPLIYSFAGGRDVFFQARVCRNLRELSKKINWKKEATRVLNKVELKRLADIQANALVETRPIHPSFLCEICKTNKLLTPAPVCIPCDDSRRRQADIYDARDTKLFQSVYLYPDFWFNTDPRSSMLVHAFRIILRQYGNRNISHKVVNHFYYDVKYGRFARVLFAWSTVSNSDSKETKEEEDKKPDAAPVPIPMIFKRFVPKTEQERKDIRQGKWIGATFRMQERYWCTFADRLQWRHRCPLCKKQMKKKEFKENPLCPKCRKGLEDHENSLDLEGSSCGVYDCRQCVWGCAFEDEYIDTVIVGNNGKDSEEEDV